MIHTVGPNYGVGNRNPELLTSCYRRVLEVADALGARSIAFPLISAGVYRWPLRDAVKIAVTTLLTTETNVADIRIVAFTEDTFELIETVLTQCGKGVNC